MLEVKEDDQRGAGGGKDGHARLPVGGAEVELDGQVHGGLPPAQGLAAQGRLNHTFIQSNSQSKHLCSY